MKTLLLIFALFSATFAVPTDLDGPSDGKDLDRLFEDIQENALEQQDDGGDDDEGMRSLMEQLMRGVVVQMQEEEEQQTSVELQSAMRDLLAGVQDEDEEGDGLALLQEGDDDIGAGQFDSGSDAEMQGGLSKIFGLVHRFSGRVNSMCNQVKKYSKYLVCLPKMQAEIERADEDDDELGKDLLRRIANVQDGDAEAQFFKRMFRGAKKLFNKIKRRGTKTYNKIRSSVGRVYRAYKGIRRCIKRIG